MQLISPIMFAIFAMVLGIYTFFFVDPTHYFLINAAWDSNMIEVKMLSYLIAGLGVCLALFYAFFSKILYSKGLIALHIILYFLLCLILILWDNNIFSFREVVASQLYSSVGDVRHEYQNILDKDHAYRVLFWVFLFLQTIGLFNLVLSFFKTKEA